MADHGRILLADDDDTFLQSTARLLQKRGYACDIAPDATAAGNLLKANGYDLLIADIRMPGNPNLELVREVQRHAVGMPVVVVTGYPSLDSAIEAVRLPVVAYLVKPFEFEELLVHVDRTLAHVRQSRLLRETERQLQALRDGVLGVEQLKLGTAAGHTEVARLVLHNIAASLLDLDRLWQDRPARHHESCQPFNCARAERLLDAMRDTVQTLERTRRSFKSQELADLRKRLQRMLMGIEAPEAAS